MITNYLKIAFRNITRHKGFSFINILGLTLGIACALLIFMWVYDEITYDRFHNQIDSIYRVEQDQFYDGEAYHVNVTPYPSGEGWKMEVPEIEDAIRFAYTGNLLLKYEEKSFFESGITAVDSTIFSVFSFDPNCGRAIATMMLESASKSTVNFIAGRVVLTFGISTDRISFCPNRFNAFLRCILEYQKKTIRAGISSNAYKYSGFANLNISIIVQSFKFKVPSSLWILVIRYWKFYISYFSCDIHDWLFHS